MIFNRTEKDVSEAKRIIQQKVQKFIALNEKEIETLEKGCVTISTLNRIENAQRVLKDALVALGNSIEVETKYWFETDIFTDNDFGRLLINLDKLKSVLPPNKETPKTPSVSFDYLTMNNIEKTIYDLQTLEENTRKSFFYSGELFCGEV